MEPTHEPTNLEESVAEVMQSLPPVIRQYLAEERYTPIAKELMAKHNLRLDQGGILERGIMLLLMGVDTPDEFIRSLDDDAHLDAQTIKDITREVNEQIFVPLRAREEKEGGMPQTIIEPAREMSMPPAAGPMLSAPEAPRPAPIAPITSYAADPYREPVDEPADEM